MAIQTINVGTSPNDGTGDTVRDAFIKVNGNFTPIDFLALDGLADPGADRILFWDDSANVTAWLSLSSELVITGTTLGIGAGMLTEAMLDSALATKVNNTAPSKFDATTAPDSDDDDSNTGGNGTFAVGSVWINVTGDEAYRCVDASTGAAVWINTTLETGELGTIATQNANAVNITGGTITGITDLALADGGTGASDAPTARTNLGLDPLAAIKSKQDATVAPTVDNDTTEGYEVGSRWIDVTADKEYVCLDATDGAAVWTETTGAGGGGSGLNDPELVGASQIFRQDADGAGDIFTFEGVTGTGEMVASSGNQAFMDLAPFVNQSGTGSYTAILLDITETALGSGDSLIADLKVDGSTLFSIGNDGTVHIVSGQGALIIGPTAHPAAYAGGDNAYLVLDRNTGTNDCTIVFRDAGNARAEIGLESDDDIQFKTVTGTYLSETFATRMEIRASDGFVSFFNGIQFEGSGAFSAGRIYKDAASGLVISAITGTTFDFLLANRSGSNILGNPANTQDLEVYGKVNFLDNVLQRPELQDYSETTVTGNSTTSYAIDLSLGNYFEITMTGNCTFSFTNVPASGKGWGVTVILIQDATGGRTWTLPGGVKWPGGTEPTLSTGANDEDVFVFTGRTGTTTIYGGTVGQDYS